MRIRPERVQIGLVPLPKGCATSGGNKGHSPQDVNHVAGSVGFIWGLPSKCFKIRSQTLLPIAKAANEGFGKMWMLFLHGLRVRVPLKEAGKDVICVYLSGRCSAW